MGYILNSCVYENTFKKFLKEGEFTNGDEVLADMNEPMGEKISSLSGTHNTATCKAFVATTTADRVLVAVYDIWGKFYRCYCGEKVRDVVAKKCFGGSNISFVTNTQYGELWVRMYVANRQFGTDLKHQKEHKESLIVNLESMVGRTYGESVQYPVSEFIKNAPILTSWWGQRFYEPLGIRTACYKGKIYQYYTEDKKTNTVLLYTGNPDSVKEGFVLEDEVRTCMKIGDYGKLPKGAYYKEIREEVVECVILRVFYAEYKGCSFSLTDIREDRVTLVLSVNRGEEPPKGFDKDKLKKAGFEERYEVAEHAWMPDKWTYTKREVPYNDSDLEIYVRTHYCAGEKKDEIERVYFL